MAVEDEVWRPGYSGPPPVSGETSFDRMTTTRDDEPGHRLRSKRVPLAVASTVAALVAGGVGAGSLTIGSDLDGAIEPLASLQAVDDDRLQFVLPASDGSIVPLNGLGRPFADTDARRLPDSIPLLWTAEFPRLAADGGRSATTWAHAIGDRYVVVGTANSRTISGPSVVHLLDASTGEQLWATSFDLRLDRVDVVDVFDDVLIVTVDSEVIAFDLETGEESWTTALARSDEGLQRVERLRGTGLLGLPSPDPGAPFFVVDPATGVVLAEMIGTVVGTDLSGRWYVLRGDKLLEFDLGAQGAPVPSGRVPPTVVGTELVGTFDSTIDRPVAVVAGTLVTIVEGRFAIGPLSVDGERATGPDGWTPLSTDIGLPDEFVIATRFVPLGGASFAIVGGGTVTGAELVDDTVRFAWQRSGTISASHETPEGAVLVIETDEGAAQTLVDAATGETIASPTMSSGFFDSLGVADNGVVTRDVTSDGIRIAGLDLAGAERWTLDGSTPVSIGDGIVVRSDARADGSFEVSAYGDVG